MGKDTDFDFGWNEADNLAPPWRHRDSERASAGTGRRTAQQASAVPASGKLEYACALAEKMVHNITVTVRKAYRSEMANRNGNKKQSDFLKAEHISEKGKTPMKVTGVGYIGDSGYGLKINFDVEIKGKKYTFGIKPTNLSIKTLLGKTIAGKLVMVERDEYDGKEYVKVSEDQ